MKNIILMTFAVALMVASNREIGHCQETRPIKMMEQVPIRAPKDSSLLDFVFRDSLDRAVRISDFKGKYVMIDMFFTGCGACIDVAEALRKVHDSFKHEEIVFISLSTDKNKEVWLQSIRENAKKTKLNPWAGRYVARKGTVMLYTGGTGNENDFCRKYVPSRFYPKLLLVDPEGKVVAKEIPRPDRDPVAFMSYISGLF